MAKRRENTNPIEKYGGTIDVADIPRWFSIYRRVLGILPEDPRCKACHAPFQGIGAPIVRFLLGKEPSNYSRLLCSQCEKQIRENPGGTELELSVLFADVRGSTALAEKMSPSEFRDLIDSFYSSATQIFVRGNAFVDKLSGDEVLAVYLPALAGSEHATQAILDAQKLMEVTGHNDPQGPWVKVGASVHTGVVWFGSLGSPNQVTDLTVLGDSVNTAARLATEAGPGEILVSEDSLRVSRFKGENYKRRRLQLKGKNAPVVARVIAFGAGGASGDDAS